MAIPVYLVKYLFERHTKFAYFLAVLSLATLIFYRYIFFTLAIWSFVFGVVAAYYILSSDFLLPSLLPYFRYERQSKVGSAADDEFTLMKIQCSVCGQRRCPRHRQDLNILAFQPWTGLEVRETVDKALDEFLTIVLNEFVYTWYRTVSTDEEFVDELRTSIRFLLSVLLRRAKKIDVPNMVKSKLLRASLQHLQAFLKARKQARQGEDLQEATLRLLGPSLHYAMNSRKSELEYVRRMVEKLFPFILRPQALQSRAMCALLREILAASVIMPALDAVANPDMVNKIILVLLDPTPAPPPPEVPSPLVPFLASFSNQKLPSLGDPDLPPKISKSSLRFVLVEVMDVDCPKMLYPFMQFLKGEAAVNVLQFALSCEDFNKKILDPELSQQDLVRLHSDVCDLYRNYLAPGAPDRISFEDSIVSEMQEIVTGDPEDVIKLRRSTPMFRAYEHVYNLLNHTFLPLFHQSAEYYTMICGERLASQMSRSTSNPVKKGNALSVLGSKISKVFKPSDTRSLNSLDMLDIENSDDADTVTVASTSSLDDNVSLSDLDAALDHDLSTWRVTIPRLGARPDPENLKKQFFVFIVEIRRVDVPNVEAKAVWSVARKYQEFYILEEKLKDFHGEMEDCSLPDKKMFGTNKYDFIDSKRDGLEQYIQKLLTLPYLKGSQLLYTFLTSDKAFDFGLDINIGRALNKIPGKLVKEKGKHLESFLQGFEKSIEAKAPTPGKRERRDSDASQSSNSSVKLCHSLYENNANGLDLRDSPPGSLLADQKHVEGIYDTLIYIARNVYCVPVWLHHVLYTARMFVKETLEGYLDWYIDHKFAMVTQEHRLVSLVHLLRDVLFYDTSPPRMDDEKTARFQETLTSCLNFLPKAAVLAMGDELHQTGTQTILNCLQQPKLNKQLSYTFLDIIVLELFPEISTDSPMSP